ncbi:glycoside hydrolase family 43 protein [Lewinella sp. IMCC34183]|uniref:glycoside hydrolase family 43 protein n=1 Tax=Lewinella sp. IMCC34183 TaxID=2248762 RepID=UPI000E2549E1|nr:glycoside hydrolase family 43 protein [Lewinella sp. IMCC34183]
MNKLFPLLLLLAACGTPKPEPATATAAQADMAAYLMTYFKDNDHSLHFALSTDGYTFTDVNGGEAVIGGDSIASQRGIRDPHITRGPDGAFYVAMTDLHLFARRLGYRETTWERPEEQYGWGNNRGFVLMKSHDLIDWTHHNFIFEEAFPELGPIGSTWAPQTIYDPEEDKMMLYFTMRLGNGKTKMYYAYTDDDFTRAVTRPELIFEYPDTNIQVLDADIIRMPDGRYCMTYVAQEQPGGIKKAVSDHINRGYVYESEMVDREPGACEAPNMWQRIGEEEYVLMYDVFSVDPHNFGFVETTDFVTWEGIGHFNEGVMKTTNFTSPKHGAVVQLTRKEATTLATHWGMPLEF